MSRDLQFLAQKCCTDFVEMLEHSGCGRPWPSHWPWHSLVGCRCLEPQWTAVEDIWWCWRLHRFHRDTVFRHTCMCQAAIIVTCSMPKVLLLSHHIIHTCWYKLNSKLAYYSAEGSGRGNPFSQKKTATVIWQGYLRCPISQPVENPMDANNT